MDDSRLAISQAELPQWRLCWVCFESEQEDTNSKAVWICPCQCKGTMKWVHEECLQRWIDEKQKRTHSPRVTCSQCKTQYILSFPPVNCLVNLIEHYDRLLYGSSPFVAMSIVVGSIYWCCGSYGFVSVIQIMGYEEGKRAIDASDPLLLKIGLPVIPITLILAKLIKWEEFVLQVWRRGAPKLPRPLSYIIDAPPSQPRANCDQILLEPGFNEPLSCTRMVCGALLLPSMSALFGKLLFSRLLAGSQWRRSLLGGLAFVLIKGALKIYLRKSQYIRYSQRSIENFSERHASSAGGLGGEGPAAPGAHHEPAGGGAHHQPGPSADYEYRLDDDIEPTGAPADSDSELDTRVQRTRALFSMTFRF